MKYIKTFDSFLVNENKNLQDKADAINAFGRAAKAKDFETMSQLYYEDREYNDGDYLDSYKKVISKYNLKDKFNKYFKEYDDMTDPAGGSGIHSHK